MFRNTLIGAYKEQEGVWDEMVKPNPGDPINSYRYYQEVQRRQQQQQ